MESIFWAAFEDEIQKVAADPDQSWGGTKTENPAEEKVEPIAINKAGNFKRDSFLPNRYYTQQRAVAKARKVWER